MEFTAKDVARLREITGAGMMDCKKALTNTGGDMDKAVEYLREQGLSMAAKKADRIASEGAVSAFAEGKNGAMIELNSESDFVSKGPDFQSLALEIARCAAGSKAKNMEELLAEKAGKDTIDGLINTAIAKIGEKISLRRFTKFELSGTGKIESYIHMGGKIGVLLMVDTDKDLSSNSEFDDMCHDIALQIAALSPSFIYSTEIPKETIEQEREIARAQFKNDPKNSAKPEQVLEKMIDGKINKSFFKESCLYEQDFVKEPSITVGKLVEDTGKKLGAKITLKRFERYVMGEGLEKKVDNLAEEVAKMQQK